MTMFRGRITCRVTTIATPEKSNKFRMCHHYAAKKRPSTRRLSQSTAKPSKKSTRTNPPKSQNPKKQNCRRCMWAVTSARWSNQSPALPKDSSAEAATRTTPALPSTKSSYAGLAILRYVTLLALVSSSSAPNAERSTKYQPLAIPTRCSSRSLPLWMNVFRGRLSSCRNCHRVEWPSCMRTTS